MNKLPYVLQNLPPEGRRLEGGLALRLVCGREFAMLECSRVAKPPGETEMKTVLAAVVEVWRPPAVWRGRVFIVEHEGHSHHIWRLYWPISAFEQVHSAAATQERLVPAGQGGVPF